MGALAASTVIEKINFEMLLKHRLYGNNSKPFAFKNFIFEQLTFVRVHFKTSHEMNNFA
jgi:hypothetical protein